MQMFMETNISYYLLEFSRILQVSAGIVFYYAKIEKEIALIWKQNEFNFIRIL